MAINRVDFGGNTLIDLTGDTLESAEQLLKGIIAHAKDGSVITGLMEAGGGGETQKVNGLFTPASNVKTVEIEHNLGVIPKCIIWLPRDTTIPDGYNGIGFYLLGWTGHFYSSLHSIAGNFIRIMDITLPHDGTNDGDNSESIACNATINKVTLGNPQASKTFKSGVKYSWCIVG